MYLHAVAFWLLVIFQYVQICRCFQTTAVQNVSELEIAALHDLFLSTDGPNWVWQGNGTQWNFSTPTINPCADSWIGITCSVNATAQYLNVLKLQLSQFNMWGTVPASISNLTKLQVLDFYNNGLYGNVTQEIGQLVELQQLFLGNNLFSGRLPHSFLMLQSLQRIRVGHTYMTGPFPELLCQLPKLSHIAITDSQFSGTLPACYGQLNLTALDMSANFYLWGTIPDSLGNLHYLQALDLFGTALTGNVPDIFANLSHLVVLDLSSNAFTGALPGDFDALRSLKVLLLSSNYISGPIPQALLSLPSLLACDIVSNLLTGPLYLSDRVDLPLELLLVSGNYLTGSIPDALGGYTQLKELELDSNGFTGSIPSSIAGCSQLELLDLSNNNLTGILPGALGECTLLEALILSRNELTGSIPATLSGCAVLQNLDVSYNNLTGIIPDTLGECTQLEHLTLSFNQLSGAVPATLGACTQLRQLELSDNQLSEAIPDCWDACTQLLYVYLTGNQLTGPIPVSLVLCPALQKLFLDSNQLTGSIPGQASAFPAVSIFVASDNHLTGQIPAVLFDAGYRYQIDLSGNQLTGTLPSGALRTELLYFGYNHLTGTLPDAAGVNSWTSVLNLTGNSLTGTIPDSFVSALYSMELLFLDKNELTGTLPQDWSIPAETLLYLYLNENSLTGSLPASLGDLNKLQSLNLSSNHFSGTIPASFQRLDYLQVLLLQSNELRGGIDQLFDAARQADLTTVQLSGNQLTGTLPAAAFELRSLTSFAAVDNCFEGPLPVQEICSSEALYALVLDGLSSAAACRAQVSLSSAGFKLGSLPPCLLNMPNLTTLHLSGSGLTGSLPTDVNISALLSDLSLSHNLLTGNIPETFLYRNWAKLDLSYNRLTGTLDSAQAAPFDSSTQLILQHNRLSGIIPGSMQRVGSLSILGSSMFSCQTDRRDVPAQDTDSDKYTCGSDAVNNALYVWVGLLVACAAVCCALYLRCGMPTVVWQWLKVADLETDGALRLPGLKRIVSASYVLCVLGAASAAYCVAVLMPVYAGANSYRTYTYQYAWTVSGAFLSGPVAFALEATFLLLLLLLALWLCGYVVLPRYIFGAAYTPQRATQMEAAPLVEAAAGQKAAVYAFYLLFNLSVVAGVNVAFVVASLNLNGRELTIIQILLAVFKLCFNSVVAPALQRRIRSRLARGAQDLTHEFASVQLFVALFNNIAVPCLVVAVISPSCFYDAIKRSDQITSTYLYSGSCILFGDDPHLNSGWYCIEQKIASDKTSYEAPFAYSYMCSSSFVTYYTPTFVAMCVISGFLIPVSRLLMVWLLRYLPRTSKLYALVNSYTPRVLKELRSPEAVAKARSDPLTRPLFDASQLVITLWTYLALLLTFGALFPPLALCCAAAMLSIALLAFLSAGRYVAAAEAAGRADCVEEVADSCAGVATPRQMQVALDMVLTASCLFYTLFLFDTLGDAVGFDGAYWVLIFVPLLPISLLALRAALLQWRLLLITTGNSAVRAAPEPGVELTNLADAEKGKPMQGDYELEGTAVAENPMHEQN